MNNRFLVKTPDGFKSFSMIRDAGMKRLFLVTLSNGITMRVSGDHLFIKSDDEPIQVQFLGNGVDIKTDDGLTTVIDISITEDYIDMVDLTDVDNNSKTYYTDGILSHNCEFLGSTNILVDASMLETMTNNMNASIAGITAHTVDMDGMATLTVYESPIPEHCYVVGADIADGVGGDETVIKVFDITQPLDIKEVAVLHNNTLSTMVVPFILAKIGTDYNIAPILVENNFGGSVVKMLVDVYEYENLVSTKTGRYGIYSTNQVKVEACLNMKGLICNPTVKTTFRHAMFIDQLKYFEKRAVANGTGFTYGPKNKSDDHVVATAWAFYILKKELLEMYFDAEYSQFGLTQLPTLCKNFYSAEDVSNAKIALAEKATIANSILQDKEKLVTSAENKRQEVYLHDPDQNKGRLTLDTSFEYFSDEYFTDTSTKSSDW